VLIKIWLAAAGMLVVIAAAAAWVLWPRSPAAPQAREYLNASACLLTDPSGVGPGTPGAPVWAAMESASLATRVMVSYLPDTGPADVTPMLNTLIQRKCGVIITTGTAAGQAIQAAKADPDQRFVLVSGAGLVADSPNADIVPPAAASQSIDRAIHALAAQL
jgi:basic membrane lipoprotein Med (substrate-binding protein (PBP1-ABC) superfamily)